MFSRRTAFAALALASTGVAGCRGCANDHPYVPPSAEASVAAPHDGGAAVVAEVLGDAGAEPALVAPPASTTWQVEGMSLDGKGREIVLGIVRDFDGDGKKDALVIVRPVAAERKPGASAGELMFVHGGDEAHPATIASGPSTGLQAACVPVARLERVGPKSAFAEIGSACPNGEAQRAIVVARLGATPTIAFDAIVVDPPQAPKLTLGVDVADRDKDGLDDVVLRVGLPEGTAKLAFFDRPAGPSRDPEEPEASLKPIATAAAVSAKAAKTAGSVATTAANMRALYRAMCLEGGAPRITKIHGGAATTCGTSKPLEDVQVAEVKAFAVLGDSLRAFSAAETAQAAPATRTAAKTTELQKILADAAPVLEAKSVKTLAAAVDAPKDHPEWSPLAFEANGKLLVRHKLTVTRVDPESGEGEPSDVAPWKSEVLSPDGKHRWLDAYHACEGVALRATFVPTGDADMIDVALPHTPRLGKTCSGTKGDPAPAIPIAWGNRGLEALIAGQPTLVTLEPAKGLSLTAFEEPPNQGSARTASGKLALPLWNGVLVRREKWSLVKSPDLEPFSDLRRCVISDDGTRVACIRRGKVVVATLP